MLISTLFMSGCESMPAEDTSDTTIGGIAPIAITGEIIPVNDHTADAAELSEYPITINNTVINKRPEKVVCLSSSLTEIIYELGYADRLIGRGSYCAYPEEVLSLTDFGRPASPDLDALKQIVPDVLITATAIPNIDSVALSDLGISVVYIPSPRSVDDFGRIYKAVGMIFDGLFDGSENGNKTFMSIKQQLESSGISTGSFIYVTEGLSIAGGDTFESAILSFFGNNCVGESSGYTLDKFLLENNQPDTVIINDELSEDEIRADSVLGSLAAVQNGNIIKINNSYFESPSGRIINILKELMGAEVVE